MRYVPMHPCALTRVGCDDGGVALHALGRVERVQGPWVVR